MRIFVAVSLMTLAFAGVPAAAEPVAVLVAVPVPKGMPKAQLEALFRQSVPEYAKLPGLVRTYYAIGDEARAGVSASAQAAAPPRPGTKKPGGPAR
jgi:hypothetical protein